MFIVVASASLIWTAVLTFFVIKDYRLLARVIRWSTTIYLIALGLVIPEILRVGLVVNGQDGLHWNSVLAWAVWYTLTVLALLDWRFLIPAAGVAVLFLSRAETRVLLNYGLVRLGWIDAFYSPLWWIMTARHGMPGFWSAMGMLRRKLFSSTVNLGTAAIHVLTGSALRTGDFGNLTLDDVVTWVLNQFPSGIVMGRPFRV